MPSDILPFCEVSGIATLINLPFGGGDLLSRLFREPLPALATELGCTTWAQYYLKYVISHPAVTCVIPGTSGPTHMADLLAAGEGILPDETMRREMAAAFWQRSPLRAPKKSANFGSANDNTR